MYVEHLLWARTVPEAGAKATNKMSKMANLKEAELGKPSEGDRQCSCNKNRTAATTKTRNSSSAVCLWQAT